MTLWPSVLRSVSAGDSLDRETSRRAFDSIMEGGATPAQVGALLMGMAQRGETPEELAGAAESMRAHALRVPTDYAPLVDTCGTGGDGAGTFNISTAAALVVAGAGVGVAKHGNRSISSSCGSADVLEALGAKVDMDPEACAACLDRTHFMFMFAPRFHPAAKHAAPVRRDLGIRTLFNLLGPLCNPAPVTHQVMGIFAPQLRDTAAQVLGILGLRRALVVHGHGGLDEIALSGPTEVTEWDGRGTRQFTIEPGDLGIETAGSETLAGGDATTNATIIRDVLSGAAGPPRDVVVLNAAAALYVTGTGASLAEAAAAAGESIDSGRALEALESYVEFSQRHGR